MKQEKVRRAEIMFLLTLFLFIILITAGMITIHYMFDIDWIPSIFAASLILTGIDLEVEVTNNAQRLFLTLYAILSIIIFLSLANATLGYVLTLI